MALRQARRTKERFVYILSDPRYKSGTCLTKTEKEQWRDRLLDLLPEVEESVSRAFDRELEKMNLFGLYTLSSLVKNLIDQERQSFQKLLNADHASFHKYLDAFSDPRKRKIRTASDLAMGRDGVLDK